MNFGKYVLCEQLGAGGMAVVSRAFEPGPLGFQRELVIKRIRAAFDKPSDESVQMLLTEARLSAKLRHPSIVRVYELGDVDGEFYIAMELVDGWDLRALIDACKRRRRLLSPGVACYIVAQLASALAYAHALTESDGRPLGILHRDVTPGNIMVTPAGTVKLLDFGIAKVAEHVRMGQKSTAEHSIKGKVVYMSPEQARKQPQDGRSDQFTLGIVFHELLTGKRPVVGNVPLDPLVAVFEGQVSPPSQLLPTLPPGIDAVVCKMLACDLHDRYTDCGELFRELTALTRQLAGDAAELQATLLRLGLLSTSRSAPYPMLRLTSPAELTTTALVPPPPAPLLRRLVAGLQPAVKASPHWLLAAALGMASATVVVLTHGRRHSTPQPPLAAPLQPAEEARPAPAPFREAAREPLTVPVVLTRSAPVEDPLAGGRQGGLEPSVALVSSGDDLEPARRRGHVRIRVAGTWRAEVLIDGVLVGRVPLSLSLPSQPGRHTLGLRKHGRRAWSGSIDGNSDVQVTVQLAPEADLDGAERPHSQSTAGAL